MIQRLYVHNFRCLENFTFDLKGLSSSLLIGKNGSGKSTIGLVLELFQKIGHGSNRVSELIRKKDFSYSRTDAPIRFELNVLLDDILYQYILVIELPNEKSESQILEEQLTVGGKILYGRESAQVVLYQSTKDYQTRFLVDQHLVALPIIQSSSETDPLNPFKRWLSRMVILSPIPSLMNGESNGETLVPQRDGRDIGDWFSGVLSQYPKAYMDIDKYLKKIMPDIQDIQNESTGTDSKRMSVQFQENSKTLRVLFNDLSDGEKVFFLCAIVLAANNSYGPLFCFWDEPDNYLSLSEVGHFVVALRSAFKSGGQLLVTSHNSEAIQKFSDENSFHLYRKNHLEPVRINLLSETEIGDNLIESLITGDL